MLCVAMIDRAPPLHLVRIRAAVVRALVDEIDRIVPGADLEPMLDAQLVEELAGLGRAAMDAALELAAMRCRGT
jgi:hypothetical protein